MLTNLFLFHENSRKDPWKYPQDRAYASEKNDVLAIADGITRSALAQRGSFPAEFHGGTVAEIFVNSFAELSREFKGSEGSMNDLLHEVNKRIYEFNVSMGFDYESIGENYWLGECVGGGCIVKDDFLYYGILEDTYINVLRGEQLEDLVKMKLQIMRSYRYGQELADKTGRNFEEVWAVDLRNNPSLKDESGNQLGWGSFNGQKEAESFWQVGSVQLKDSDIILLVTDGALDLFGAKEELNAAQEIMYKSGNNSGTKSQIDLSEQISGLITSGMSSLQSEKTILRAIWQQSKE